MMKQVSLSRRQPGQGKKHVMQVYFWRLAIVAWVAAAFVGSVQAQTLK